MSDRCSKLSWDSEFFGVPIGRVEGDTLTEQEADEAVEWADDNGISCLYFLAGSENEETHRIVAERGFDHVDTRLTFRAHVGRAAPTNFGGDVRDAVEEDLEALESLARVSFTTSRFYADPHFDDEDASELYAVWLRKTVLGELPGRTFVAESEGDPVGFVTCNVEPRGDSNLGTIGLIAVASEAQRLGIGAALMGAVGEHYRYSDVVRAEVVTQERNPAAQGLYERHGYKLVREERWFHRWSD